MKELSLFNFENHEVRAVLIDNEPYFLGKDVAEVLGYSNTRDALAKHVDDEDKHTVAIRDGIGNPNKVLVNESGLYSLVFGSKLPSAKRFKHWVTSEVLPTLRKTGKFEMPKTYAEALRRYADEVEKREKLQLENAEMRPKAIFADAVDSSSTDILIGDLAKLIKQNGHDIGQRRMFEWLRNNDYLIKSGSSKNMPTQRSMEMGLFRVKESTVANPDGSIRVTKTTKVTGKGQIYFVNKFCNA